MKFIGILHVARRFSGGRRLIGFAAALHVCLAVGLFIAGRTQIVPGLIDRDGIMASFAFDSYKYQTGAVQLSELLRSGNLADWATAAQPIHVKLIAIPFAVLGPIFGYGTLSAEPYNVVCYTALLALVFALGREVSGRRVGLLASAAVAVWPTFLLHTMQLLKEPLFVTALIAFLFCIITWLTRTYGPIAAALLSILTMTMTLLLCLVRINFVFVMIAIAFLGLVLLGMRQIIEQRLLLWNVAPPMVVLLTALLLIPLYSRHTIDRTKNYPAEQSGPTKLALSSAAQIPSLVTRVAKPPTNNRAPGFVMFDRLARRISSIRSRFAAVYPAAGSVLDGDAEFSNTGELLAYVPRAMEIGLWAPFPDMWVSTGRRVGQVGKLLSGAETFLIYLFQLLAVAAIVREPRRLALWFLTLIVILGVTALALIIPNIGALYRFRYSFWVMVVVAGMMGLDSIATSLALRSRQTCGLEQKSDVLLATEQVND